MSSNPLALASAAPGLTVVITEHGLLGSPTEAGVAHRTAVAGAGWQALVYGLVTDAEARRIAESLVATDDPDRALPDVPWAAAVCRPDGTVAATASMMLPGGLFHCADPDPGGRRLIVATDPGKVLAARGGPVMPESGFVASGDGTSTPFAGVLRVPPGETLLWHPRQPAPSVRLHQWCGPQALSESHRGRSAVDVRDYVSAFDLVVADLARRAVIPVLALSGGLDSTFLAASLARVAPSPCRIQAFTHTPDTASVLRAPAFISDELPLARVMESAYPGRIAVTPLRPADGRHPDDAARAAMRRSFLPCAAPVNQIWLDRVREAARRIGSPGFFVGGHGNASFSYPGVPRVLRTAGWRSRAGALTRMVAGAFGSAAMSGPGAPGSARVQFLDWLTHHGPRYPAVNPASSEGLFRLDPFSSRTMIERAALMPDREWSRGPGDRGFARRAAAGRVPDSIRLEPRRGIQGWDLAVPSRPATAPGGTSCVGLPDARRALLASAERSREAYTAFLAELCAGVACADAQDVRRSRDIPGHPRGPQPITADHAVAPVTPCQGSGGAGLRNQL